MTGIELSKRYYEFCKPTLEEQAPALMAQTAAGLVGDGSECFGYDDEISRDHDFEPGFCLFVPDGADEREVFQLERAYARLPKEFEGFRRLAVDPAGGSRHGVKRVSDFYSEKTGFARPPEDARDWLAIPQYALAAAVNGEVFTDPRGDFSARRAGFASMPEDARKKRLAGHLFMMSQAGQYNYLRCVSHGETSAAQLALFAFSDHAMQAAFLLNGRYMPFYKWSFRALRGLSTLGGIADLLDYLLTTDNMGGMPATKADLIEDCVLQFVTALQDAGLTDAVCTDLGKHAASVNDHVRDARLRNLDLLAGV